MLQCWASDREFYVGGSTLLCQFIESVMFAHCVFYICIGVYVVRTIQRFFTYDGLLLVLTCASIFYLSFNCGLGNTKSLRNQSLGHAISNLCDDEASFPTL